MEILFIWLAVATVTAIAASSRGRSAFLWFVLGFLFSVFALIAVLVMPPAQAQTQPTAGDRRPAGSFAPATMPRGGDLIRYYKGHAIRASRALNPHGASVAGREFENENLAMYWIDDQERATPAPAPDVRAMRKAVNLPQSDARRTPLRVAGDGHFDQFVAGTSNYQSQIAALDDGRRRKFLVTLQAEPTNAHDARAVAVRHQGTTLGYLPREDATAWHEDLADAGHQPPPPAEAWARIVGGGADTPTLGLRLDLAWPIEASARE